MKKKIITLFATAFILAVACAGTSFAATAVDRSGLTMEDIDAVTGPSFGISSTYSVGDDIAVLGQAPTAEAPAVEHGKAGSLIGNFKTTGYCNCEKCTSVPGSLTAAGTTPTANHTVSADWSILPKGTKILIGDSDIVYTVEDTGVSGQVVDVFYADHQTALAHGLSYQNIYYAE